MQDFLANQRSEGFRMLRRADQPKKTNDGFEEFTIGGRNMNRGSEHAVVGRSKIRRQLLPGQGARHVEQSPGCSARPGEVDPQYIGMESHRSPFYLFFRKRESAQR